MMTAVKLLYLDLFEDSRQMKDNFLDTLSMDRLTDDSGTQVASTIGHYVRIRIQFLPLSSTAASAHRAGQS